MPIEKRWWIALSLGFLCGVILPAGNGKAQEPAKPAEQMTEQPAAAYRAKDGAYTLTIPQDWESTWSNAANDRNPSELQLVAPGLSWPEHVLITVFHYASAYRTAERYLFDLQNPSFGGKDQIRSPVADTLVAGIPAKAIDVSANRHPLPGMTGETVPSFTRSVVVPARQGFFVLRLDSPQGVSAEYRVIFDRLVDSFSPADQNRGQAQQEIPAKEYEVYSAFFTARPPEVVEPAQLFSSAPECRLVNGQTLPLDKPAPPPWHGDGFSTLESSLIEDYNQKNQKTWQLTDRIMVPDLVVISTEELDARFSAGRLSPDGMDEDAFLFRDGLVSLSRVGFNSEGDTAVLDVSLAYPRAMRARYLVIMRLQAGTWIIDRAVLKDFIYH